MALEKLICPPIPPLGLPALVSALCFCAFAFFAILPVILLMALTDVWPAAGSNVYPVFLSPHICRIIDACGCERKRSSTDMEVTILTDKF